jgi:hypothetical protein
LDKQRIAANLAAVENHFHSEALNEVEATLATFTEMRDGKIAKEIVSTWVGR